MSRRFLVLVLAVLTLSGCQDSGDRVLVGKFLYDSNITPPGRYDVVVFKYPAMPIENGSPKNYIKRLLGLPAELIAIFFGRIFSFRHDGSGVPAGLEKEEWQRLTAPQHDALELWRHPPKNHDVARKLWEESREAEKSGKKGSFQILRKPTEVMLPNGLSRPVYDNNHQAQDLLGVLPPRWAPRTGSAWAGDNSFGFKSSDASNSQQWLHYRHILRPADMPAKDYLRIDPTKGNVEKADYDAKKAIYDGKINAIKAGDNMPRLITDFLGYNTYRVGGHESPAGNWVGDLMLSFKLTVDEPKGEFWMELCRGVDRFQARFELANGKCSLYRRTTHIAENGVRTVSDWQLLGSADTRVKAKGDYQVRFANYDDRLTLWVGRDLPFGEGKEYPSPAEVGPDRTPLKEKTTLDEIENNDLQPASLCSVGAAVQVHNLQLWRDTYYTGFTDSSMLVSDQTAVHGDDWGHPNRWDPIRNLQAKTIYVYPGHFLCLGDNSQESSDSRQWGLVPERLMLGRALLVYFPFERAGTIK